MSSILHVTVESLWRWTAQNNNLLELNQKDTFLNEAGLFWYNNSYTSRTFVSVTPLNICWIPLYSMVWGNVQMRSGLNIKEPHSIIKTLYDLVCTYIVWLSTTIHKIGNHINISKDNMIRTNFHCKRDRTAMKDPFHFTCAPCLYSRHIHLIQ